MVVTEGRIQRENREKSLLQSVVSNTKDYFEAEFTIMNAH